MSNKNNNKTTFSKNLSKIRKEKGLTLENLSKLTGLTQRMIFYYENQAVKPPIDKIEIIAKALNIKINDLLGTNESITPLNEKNEFVELDARTIKKIKMILSLSKQERHIIYSLAETFIRNKKKKKSKQSTES